MTMKKALALLALLPLLTSCGHYQNSYNEEIRSTYPAYYYEATMDDFFKLHEKKENYYSVYQFGYYGSAVFTSNDYNPDFFPGIYEILKTSTGIKKRKYDSETKNTFYYRLYVRFTARNTKYYAGMGSEFIVRCNEDLNCFVIDTCYGDDDDWFPLRKTAYYEFTEEQSKALKDYATEVANVDEITDE